MEATKVQFKLPSSTLKSQKLLPLRVASVFTNVPPLTSKEQPVIKTLQF